MGHRAAPQGAAQAGHPDGQAHGPAPHARGTPPAAPGGRADVGDLPAGPRPRDLGLRLPPSRRPRVSVTPRLLRRRARLAPGRPRRRDAAPHRRLGRPATPRGHALRPTAAVPHPRQRQQVWPSIHPGRSDERDQGTADGLPCDASPQHRGSPEKLVRGDRDNPIGRKWRAKGCWRSPLRPGPRRCSGAGSDRRTSVGLSAARPAGRRGSPGTRRASGPMRGAGGARTTTISGDCCASRPITLVPADAAADSVWRV